MAVLTEQFANGAATTLASAISSTGATSCSVTSATGFPSAGNFRILIDSEIMLVTAVSGTTFTITRGIESTSAATHSNGAAVTHILTAGSYGQGIQDRIVWPPFTPPNDSSFSWINQNSATTTQNARGAGAVYLASPAINSGQPVVGRSVSAPSTPYHIVTYIEPSIFGAEFLGYGIGFQDSGTKLVISLTLAATGSGPLIYAGKFSDPNTQSGNYGTNSIIELPRWQRMGDNGTNLTFDLSPDGVNWWNWFSASRTDYLSGGPASVLWFVYPASSTYSSQATLYHWLVTA